MSMSLAHISVFHPDFNFEFDDAHAASERFEGHVRSVDRGVDGIRTMWMRLREASKGVFRLGETQLFLAVMGRRPSVERHALT
jgi:hypothetical protein